MDKREWFALDMSTNEIYDYAMALQALADKRLVLLKRLQPYVVHADYCKKAWYKACYCDCGVESLRIELEEIINGR